MFGAQSAASTVEFIQPANSVSFFLQVQFFFSFLQCLWFVRFFFSPRLSALLLFLCPLLLCAAMRCSIFLFLFSVFIHSSSSFCPFSFQIFSFLSFFCCLCRKHRMNPFKLLAHCLTFLQLKFSSVPIDCLPPCLSSSHLIPFGFP